MGLRISGKSIEIGDAFREQVDLRIGEAISKYFDGGFAGHLTVEREGSGYKTDCAIHLDTGIVLRAVGHAQDVHRSFDIAAERIDKRLRRYKRRLKGHSHDKPGDTIAAAAYVIEALDEEAEVAHDYNPTIIAEETTDLATMTVGGAVTAMDMADLPVVVFRHAGHGGINVVYRRSDGHIGWIDPSLDSKRKSAKH
jgi:ribosomal subunit interface protein